MARPSVLVVVLPLVLATALLATAANAQNYTAPSPSPLPDNPSPPPPPPESSTAPPPASQPPPAPSPSPSPPASSPSPPSPPPPPPPSPPPPSSSPPPPPPPASNWTPVANVKDPKIQQVAQFAVRMYALSSRELNMQLLNVVSGETQPSSNGGYNYRLIMTVSGSKNTQYEAFVWGILGTTSWKLLSFTPKY